MCAHTGSPKVDDDGDDGDDNEKLVKVTLCVTDSGLPIFLGPDKTLFCVRSPVLALALEVRQCGRSLGQAG